MSSLDRIRGCRSGAAALEFAIVSTFFVLLCLGIIESGRSFQLRSELALAADVGARRIMMDPTITGPALDGAIRSAFTYGNPALLQIDISTVLPNGMSGREVVIRYPLTLRIPGLGAITLRVARRVPVVTV